jgi:EAL domain-containing protein (putative c-di-GMP-specific phosphodiesterase class I)/CheY-like chemotaxis protein
MESIRVMLVDDEETVLDVMTEVMSSDRSIDVVATARDPREAYVLATESRPDVALVDVRMPGGGGPVAARGIRRGSPDTRVVAVSADADPEVVISMITAGATGYIGKDEPVEQLLRAVHRSAEGRATISVGSIEATAELLAEQLSDHEARAARAAADRVATAIVGPGLHMVFQPIVELSSGRILGLEALARFTDRPRRSPDTWFAEAAKVGLLEELELEAVRRAVGELRHVPTGAFLSINLSPETLGSDGLAELIDPSVARRIVIEITERSRIRGYDTLIARMRPLRALGVRFAIDDVGAGFSSLERVIHLEPDFMKLDGSTVTGLAEDPMRRALIERLVSFSDDIGVSVIAEGIEGRRDLDVLRTLYVPYGQGHYLGRPGPIPAAADVEAWPGQHAFAWRQRRDAG